MHVLKKANDSKKSFYSFPFSFKTYSLTVSSIHYKLFLDFQI